MNLIQYDSQLFKKPSAKKNTLGLGIALSALPTALLIKNYPLALIGQSLLGHGTNMVCLRSCALNIISVAGIMLSASKTHGYLNTKEEEKAIRKQEEKFAHFLLLMQQSRKNPL